MTIDVSKKPPTNAPAPQFPLWSFVFVDLTTDATPAEMKPAPAFAKAISDYNWDQNTALGPFAAEFGQQRTVYRVASGPNDRKSGEIAVNFRDTIPEAPGALAYHTVTNGVPDIEIGTDLFDSVLDGNDPIFMGVDHELKELLKDAGANGWKDLQDGSGLTRAEEECDTVQNTAYKGPSGTKLANFLLRSAFIPGAPGPWDALKVMQSQDDYSNGYEAQATAPTDVQQVVGGQAITKEVHGLNKTADGRHVFARGAENLTENQRKRKAHPYSRTYRRGVRL